jgi:hypothetical protein
VSFGSVLASLAHAMLIDHSNVYESATVQLDGVMLLSGGGAGEAWEVVGNIYHSRIVEEICFRFERGQQPL